jgi:hypothetical protein
MGAGVVNSEQDLARRRCYFLLPVSYFLALPLLVLGILANDANHALAMNHLALVTNWLYGCTNLHFKLLNLGCSRLKRTLCARGLRPSF